MAQITILQLALSTFHPGVLITLNMLYTNVVVIYWIPSDFMINSSVSLATLFRAYLYVTASLIVVPLSLMVAPIEVKGVTVVVVVVVVATVAVLVVVVEVDWLPLCICLVLAIMYFLQNLDHRFYQLLKL